jgi:hypothetical protein
MPEKGDTVIHTGKIPLFKNPMLTVKDSSNTGRILFKNDDYNCRSVNVCGKNRNGNKIDIKFVFDISYISEPLSSSSFDQKNAAGYYRFPQLSSSNIQYCIPYPINDAVNFQDNCLRDKIKSRIDSRNTGWQECSNEFSDLYGSRDTVDSLSNYELAYARNHGIEYVLIFYNYGYRNARGIAPVDVGSSAAISAAGMAAGALTGSYFFAVPTGKSRLAAFTVKCKLLSARTNRCVFSTNVQRTIYNPEDLLTETDSIYETLFKKIGPLFNFKE